MSMSTMSDAERLALLKQVGGTSVYEERRAESLKILQETEARRSRINEVIVHLARLGEENITRHKSVAHADDLRFCVPFCELREAAVQVTQLNEQLTTLEAEQAELAKFQAADKQRRSIEYTIYDKDIAHTRDKLAQACCRKPLLGVISSQATSSSLPPCDSADALCKVTVATLALFCPSVPANLSFHAEADARKEAESAGEAKEKLAAAKSELKKLDKKLKGLVSEGTALGKAADKAEQAKRGLVTQHVQAQVEASEAAERHENGQQTQENCTQELESLAGEVQAQEAAVQEAAGKLQAEEQRSRENAAEVERCKKRLQAIYEKQGRSAQYASGAERDAFVGKEVKALQKGLKPKERSLAELQKQADAASAKLTQLQQARALHNLQQPLVAHTRILTLLAQMCSAYSPAADRHGFTCCVQDTAGKEAALQQAREAVRNLQRAQAELETCKSQMMDEKKALWGAQDERQARVRQLLEAKKGHEKRVSMYPSICQFHFLASKSMLNAKGSVVHSECVGRLHRSDRADKIEAGFHINKGWLCTGLLLFCCIFDVGVEVCAVSTAKVDSSMPWELKKGLEGMRRIVAEHRIAGVYGTLIDLLDVRVQLYSAVESDWAARGLQQRGFTFSILPIKARACGPFAFASSQITQFNATHSSLPQISAASLSAASERLLLIRAHALTPWQQHSNPFSAHALPLIPDPRPQTLCVQVTAGNALFHVVVDNDDTATRICQKLQQERAGRITCMPLNRLHPPRIEYTKAFGTDALPLVQHIKWDAGIDECLQLAFQQVKPPASCVIWLLEAGIRAHSCCCFAAPRAEKPMSVMP
ncbi:Structural maintenance of chromosomes protein 3 [Sticta canariensis]|nr:Structural maintenance of chromosomes protein 3 [Sticta canariensis]